MTGCKCIPLETLIRANLEEKPVPACEHTEPEAIATSTALALNAAALTDNLAAALGATTEGDNA